MTEPSTEEEYAARMDAADRAALADEYDHTRTCEDCVCCYEETCIHGTCQSTCPCIAD